MPVYESLEAGDPRHVGPYRIEARLGLGGMGRVYLGRTRGGRAVAVKVVRPELAGDEQFRLRFAREVAAARKVNGAFTAGVVDADPDGSPAWLATVFVAGVSLDQAVAAHGSWPAASVLALGAGLTEALEAIHAVGVVHRDLKPSNVLLASDRPRVIDFGISVVSEATALTQYGASIGTPGFMSPEQVKGLAVGPASDVFSLGAVLAFTATGSGPFGTGAAHSLNFRAVHEEPDLGGLPPEMRALLERCLAKDPGQRPSVPALLERLIESAGTGQPASQFLPQTDWLPALVARTVQAGVTPSHAEPTAEARRPPLQPPRPAPDVRPTSPPVSAAATESRAASASSRHWLRAVVVVCVLALPVLVTIWAMRSGTSAGRNTPVGHATGAVSTGGGRSSSTRPSLSPSRSPSGAKSTGSSEVAVTTFETGPIRSDPSRNSQQLGTLATGHNRILCRAQGDIVHDNGVYNSWWLWTQSNTGSTNGWVSAYYISGTDQAKADDGTDIPDCGTLAPSNLLSATGSSEVAVTTFETGPIRSDPSRNSQQLGTLATGHNRILCRAQGETVHDNGVYNSWWLWTQSNTGSTNGWVSAYYISGTDQAKADDGTDIPDCGTLAPSSLVAH